MRIFSGFSLVVVIFFSGMLLTMPGETFHEAGETGPATAGDQQDLLLVADFSSSVDELGWFVVNDNVMGGRSEGDFEVIEGQLRFTGRTNTNGGGFSSIRSKPLDLDLSQYGGVRVRVRGDGRRYTWRLTTTARRYGREIAYWADFDTADGEWQDVDIPFTDFVPRFRGTALDGPALDTTSITGMGLMIYDKRDGDFHLSLASVSAYAKTPPKQGE